MVYRLDIDPLAAEQIRALPPKALAALAEAFEVLGLVPERVSRYGEGRGLITYLLLVDQERVDVLLVTWVWFDDSGL